MPLQPMRVLEVCSVSLLLVLLLPGCKDDAACVKARNAASDAWKGVNESAAKNKVAPAIGLDEVPADKKGAHVDAWGTLEKQAEMLASSFAYEMITWNTAVPAQQKANAAFEGYFAKDKFKSFEVQLKDANDKYKAAAVACRD